MIKINWNPSERELRQFAGIWLPAFAVLVGAVVAYRFGSAGVAASLWAVAGGVALVGLTKPAAVKPLFVGWMVAAYPIGWTISHVVLAGIYYGLFTLTGLVLRAVGYDPLRRRRQSAGESLWVRREARTDPDRYFRPF